MHESIHLSVENSYQYLIVERTYEDIQNKIILYYFPQFAENIKYIRRYNNMTDVKTYCEEVIKNSDILGKIIIIISNRQILIIDKSIQEVYVLDPTSMLHIKSIYNIDYLESTILPLFKYNNYNYQYVQLTYPMQTENIDPYSQTWLMIVLIKTLTQLYSSNTIPIILIPDNRKEKQKVLSNFYINILNHIQIKRELNHIFLEIILSNIHLFDTLYDLGIVLNIDPVQKIIEDEL